MDSETEILEEKLKSLCGRLQAECNIFERLVYKNKNQHRRSSYFQYLLKVRRDLRLLQSAKLEELLGSCFQVITGNKPKTKVHLLESLKRRKRDGEKHNFMKRLLGAARLLSQMVEPMLKAASEISTLLARSFFMGFSLTILALLARLRVLVQQMLLDVVSVFNKVSSLSQQKQSINIALEGIEVYREFYPAKENSVTLQCVWDTDKFVLHERSDSSEIKSQEVDTGSNVPIGGSGVLYNSIESFLGDDELDSEKVDADSIAAEGPTNINADKTNLLVDPSSEGNDRMQVDDSVKIEDDSDISETPMSATSSSSSNPLKVKSSMKKVAFVSVKRPASSTSNSLNLGFEAIEKKNDDKEDKFYSLLTAGNLKDSLF